MNPQLLIDWGRLDPVQMISESKEAGTMKVRGIFGRAEEFNANNRRYKKTLLEREVNRLVPLINERRLLGAADHPDSSQVSLMNASHLITKLGWQGNILIGEAEVLNTPNGKVVQQLYRDGVKIGISSRALGTLSECKELPGKFEVNEDLKLVTFDLVADPSTNGAHPTRLSESTQALIESTKRECLSQKILLNILENRLAKVKDDRINQLFEGKTERTVPEWAKKAKLVDKASRNGKLTFADKVKKGHFKMNQEGSVSDKGDSASYANDGIRSTKRKADANKQRHKKERQKGKKEAQEESTQFPKLKQLLEGYSTGENPIATGVRVGKFLGKKKSGGYSTKNIKRAGSIGNKIHRKFAKKHGEQHGAHQSGQYTGAELATQQATSEKLSKQRNNAFSRRLLKKYK